MRTIKRHIDKDGKTIVTIEEKVERLPERYSIQMGNGYLSICPEDLPLSIHQEFGKYSPYGTLAMPTNKPELTLADITNTVRLLRAQQQLEEFRYCKMREKIETFWSKVFRGGQL